jgi:putative lipoprotein
LRFIVTNCDFDLGAVVDKFITGKITHVGSNHIDKNAQIAVSLQDVSLMDAAAKFLATTSISDAKTFPISYKLKYNPADIKPHHTYAIMARITGPDNRLLFLNDVETRAEFTGSRSPTVDIAVIRGK